jgi:dTDP-4-dehydrorhamnose 3,5-epimerase
LGYRDDLEEAGVNLIREIQAIFKYQDYGAKPSIEGVALQTLRRFNEDGGSMTELGRFAGGLLSSAAGFELAQLNFSVVEPGVIKAFHVHHRQTDVWFVPPEDRVVVVLVDVRDGSPTAKIATKLMLGDGSSRLLRIPPGVAHGCRNIGAASARIVYMTDVAFSPEPGANDEGRLPWDLVGAEIWEPSKD